MSPGDAGEGSEGLPAIEAYLRQDPADATSLDESFDMLRRIAGAGGRS